MSKQSTPKKGSTAYKRWNVSKIKEYTETKEFRKGLDKELGTTSTPLRMTRGVHWVVHKPRMNTLSPKYKVQHFDYRDEDNDDLCSIYSLYNQLRLAWNKKFTTDQIPDLNYVCGKDAENVKKIKSLRKPNMELIKQHLPKLLHFKFPTVKAWAGWTDDIMKENFKALLDNFEGLW